MSLEENQTNPFIGNAFPIEFADEEEIKATAEEAPEIEKPAEVEQEQETEEKEIEIEDILDKDVKFDDEKPDSEEDKQVQAALESDDDDFDYQALAQRLVDSGHWEDFDVPEDVEFDKEAFETVAKAQDAEKKKNLKQEVFDSLDDADKEFMEFRKQGGDLEEYMRSRTRLNNVQNINLETEEGKISAIYTYYKNFVGWKDDKIRKHIEKLDEEELREEAEMTGGEIKSFVEKQHNDLIQAQYQAAQQRQERIKKFRSTAQDKLKELGVDTKKAKAVLDGISKVDEKTGFAPVDKAYFEARNNPELAIELYEFLTDRESYLKKVSESQVDETKKKLFFTLKGKKKQEEDTKLNTEKGKKRINPFSNVL